MLKSLTNIITGIWHGREVHDKELLVRYVLGSLALAFVIGICVHLPSCGKQELPSHIQTANGR